MAHIMPILKLLITAADEMSQIRQIRVYFISSNYKGIETYLNGIMNMYLFVI